MTDDQTISQIKQRVDNLKKLFDDPQPGLFVWANMVSKEMDWLVNWWQHGLTPHNPTAPCVSAGPV